MTEKELYLRTAGGRITCQRCQAISRREKRQCLAPAIKGKSVCRVHGGKSTGPKTAAGRKRIADAKTVHGRETRAIRAQRSLVSAHLRLCASLLGLGSDRKKQ
jgi:hypothetical protein